MIIYTCKRNNKVSVKRIMYCFLFASVDKNNTIPSELKLVKYRNGYKQIK